MKSLNEYVNESLFFEQLDFLKEDSINEGWLSDKLKKLWKWIKNEFRGNSPETDDNDENAHRFKDLINKDVEYEQVKNKKDKITLDMFTYDYNKMTDKIQKLDIFKNVKFNSKNTSKLKIVFANINGSKSYEAMIAYVTYEHNPLSEVKKFKSYNYVYAFNVGKEYKKYKMTILMSFLNAIKNNVTKDKADGFIISNDIYSTDSGTFDKNGFKEEKDVQVDKNQLLNVHYIDNDSFSNRLSESLNEELDENMFYLLDMWFGTRENEQRQFIDIIVKCKQDGAVQEKKLSQYIKGTFLENQLNEFINFLENDMVPDDTRNNLYSLKKIIECVIFDKRNKYIQKFTG